MTFKITKKELIDYLTLQCDMFKDDFDHKEYGNRAKLLHKHYQGILVLVEKME